MSICFMELISINYENTKYLINQFVIQECGDFSWRVSTYEELVGDKFLNRFMGKKIWRRIGEFLKQICTKGAQFGFSVSSENL